MNYADEITRNPTRGSDAVFDRLRSFWTDDQIVELTAAAALFNFFNRFSGALEIDPTVYPRSLAEPAPGAP